MTQLPTGKMTFLFTDIEGSTRLWEENPGAMRHALIRHDALLRSVIESSGGRVFKTTGDGFCAVFSSPRDAAAAALAAQLALAAWEPADFTAETQRAQSGIEVAGQYQDGSPDPEQGDRSRAPSSSSSNILSSLRPLRLCGESVPSRVPQLRVRMALHTGEAERRDGDYFGPALCRVARLLNAGHGGQILLSGATRDLLEAALPAGATLKALGVHRLRDLQNPERIFQLLHPELPGEFAPLRTVNAPWMAHHSQTSSTSAPPWISTPAPRISTLPAPQARRRDAASRARSQSSPLSWSSRRRRMRTLPVMKGVDANLYAGI
jgi:class 3 adenylate cyclase